MGASIVGDDLRVARRVTKSENRESGISIARMQGIDASINFLHRARTRSAGQVPRHAKGEFRLADAHFISGIDAVPPSEHGLDRMRPAIGPSTLMCFWPASLWRRSSQPE